MDTNVPSPLSPSDPPRCDRPIRQILKILFHSPERALRFTADRAFVGQGAASGAVRPAPAIRRYKRGFLRRFAGSTVQHLALELLQQVHPARHLFHQSQPRSAFTEPNALEASRQWVVARDVDLEDVFHLKKLRLHSLPQSL